MTSTANPQELHTRIQHLQKRHAESERKSEKQDRKAEADDYTSTARAGQGFVTAGNLVALVALLKQAQGQEDQKRAVKGLVIASLALSGLLLVMQALNSWQYLMSRLLTWMCCGFGGRGHMTADSAGSHTRHSKHPSSGTPATSTTHDHTNPATALLTSTPGTHGDVIDLEANNAQRTADTAASPRSAVAPGDLATFESLADIHQEKEHTLPVKKQAQTSDKLFTAWQVDMNVTITVLGGVVTILNAVAVGLINNSGPGPAPSPV